MHIEPPNPAMLASNSGKLWSVISKISLLEVLIYNVCFRMSPCSFSLAKISCALSFTTFYINHYLQLKYDITFWLPPFEGHNFIIAMDIFCMGTLFHNDCYTIHSRISW